MSACSSSNSISKQDEYRASVSSLNNDLNAFLTVTPGSMPVLEESLIDVNFPNGITVRCKSNVLGQREVPRSVFSSTGRENNSEEMSVHLDRILNDVKLHLNNIKEKRASESWTDQDSKEVADVEMRIKSTIENLCQPRSLENLKKVFRMKGVKSLSVALRISEDSTRYERLIATVSEVKKFYDNVTVPNIYAGIYERAMSGLPMPI